MKANERKAVGHTAGEWESICGRIQVGTKRIATVVLPDGNTEKSVATQEANARLISQAPAMLEALSDLVETMERIGQPAITQGGLCEETDWHYDLRKAKAIIARAKGVK